MLEDIILNMSNKNFILVNCDTDAIMVAKPDGTPFEDDEINLLLKELNSILPEHINFTDDGKYERVVVIKSKNYILDNGKKMKFKGSSLCDAKKEPIILDLIHEIGHLLLDNKLPELLPLYQKYVKLSQQVTDISQWATKKTITKSVLEPSRLNEQKVLDALRRKEVQEGDKIWVYYDSADQLQLVENWEPGQESKSRLAKRIFDTFKIFQALIPFNQFPKYHLKTKQKELGELLEN